MIILIGILLTAVGFVHMARHGTGEMDHHNPADYEGSGMILVGCLLAVGGAAYEIGRFLLGLLS